MAYNTGNPLGSTDARDLADNAYNFDTAVNSPDGTWVDRLGVNRSTFEGAIQGLGFFNVGDFATGYTLTNSRQTLTYSGHEYSWAGLFPKLVVAGSSPTPLGAGGWIDRTDVTLRDDLNVVVKVFESVTDMIADASLVVGQKCSTLGYYAVGDGGGNVYEIVAAATGTDDGGSYIDLSGSGLQAKGLFLSNSVHVKQFGAQPGYASADAFSAACAYAKSIAIQDVSFGNGHIIESTVYIPVGVVLRGSGRDCKIYPDDAGTYINGWMFLVNSTDDVSWVDAYPNILSGGMKDCWFYNTNGTADRRGVKGYGSVVFENIRSYKMSQTCMRPSGFYTDNVKISRVYAEPVIGTDYQVDVRGLGDGMVVEELHFPWNAVNPGDGSANGIYIGATLGGRISECIGGNVKVSQGTVVFDNCHWEKSQLLVDGANVTVKGTVFGASGKLPVVLTSTDVQSYQFVIEQCEFLYMYGLLEWQGSDVQVDNRFTVTIRDSYRKFTKQGGVDKAQLYGLKLEKNDASPLTAFNDYSYKLSKSCIINPNYAIEKNFSIETILSYPGISASALDSTVTWGGSTNTYYYKSQSIIDKARLIARNGTNSEQSILATNSGNGVKLTIDMGSGNNTGIIRVYRGTSTGAYNYYADIHAYNAYLLYDDGATVNGVPWVARTPGAVDTINGLGEQFVQYIGANVVVRGAATPTVGTWVTGDDIYRVTPSAGGTRAWTCTAGGTGGTWNTWGAISA